MLIDRFLEDATEVDVDAIRDHTGEVLIGGVMEHVEEAGVHSGDSACALPPYSLSADTVAVIEDYTRRIAEALDVRGLINVQFAVKHVPLPGDPIHTAAEVFVIEANPRESHRPVRGQGHGRAPGQGGHPGDGGRHARPAARRGAAEARRAAWVRGRQGGGAALQPVPRRRPCARPEMRSTGEVMGIDTTFGLAFAKSQIAAGGTLPERARCSSRWPTATRPSAPRPPAGSLSLGFSIAATSGTADHLEAAGVPVTTRVAKLGETAGNGVDAVGLIESGQIDLVVNSPRGRGPRADGAHIRTAAGVALIPCLTTAAAALAAALGMADWARHPLRVRSLQDFHAGRLDDQQSLPLDGV